MASTPSFPAGNRRRHGVATRLFIVVASAMMTMSPSPAMLLQAEEPSPIVEDLSTILEDPTGTVQGVVWSDVDGDGVRQSDEEGLEGVELVLFDDADQNIDSTVSNDDGVYAFDAIGEGSSRVRAALPEGYDLSPGHSPEDFAGETVNVFTLTDLGDAETQLFDVAAGLELVLGLGLSPTPEDSEPAATTTTTIPEVTTTTTVAPTETTTTEPATADATASDAEETDDQPTFGLLAVNPAGTFIANAQTFYAYVDAGETLDVLFTRIANRTTNDVVITVTDPTGTSHDGTAHDNPPGGPIVVADPCVLTDGGTGAATCTFSGLSSATAGIWEIDFNTNPPGGSNQADHFDWSITVSDGGTEVPGRVYSEAYHMYQNAAADVTFWYQGETGYQYRGSHLGYNGVGSFFRGDVTGIRQNGTCVSAYRNILTSNTSPDSLTPGFSLSALGECGDPYKIFFEPPDPALPASGQLPDGSSTWILPPVQTPTLSDLGFVGDSTSVRSGDVTFDVTGFTGQVDVYIDVDNNGVFDDPIDVALGGFASGGSGTAYFDGIDGLGNPVPSIQEIGVRAEITRVGELHFASWDVEFRTEGLEVEVTRGGSGILPLYWNDTFDPSGGASCDAVADGTAGTTSAGGAHLWGPDGPCPTNWGNQKAVDDWTFVPVDVSEEIIVPGFVQEPWACTPDGILFQAPITVFVVDLVTGDFDIVAEDYYEHDINAVGYNILDGYIYGHASGSAPEDLQIVRIGADGSVVELGYPTNVPVPAANRHIGDVDENGHYWMTNGTAWFQIDVDPSSSTYFEVLDSGTNAAIGGGWGYADWAYVPGGGNYLYTVATNAGDSQLFRFDRATHVWGPVGGSLGNLGGAIGAVYADAEGFLYGSVNADGDIYRVNVQTGTAAFFTEGPASGGNDGAMCIEARVLLDFGDAPNSYGTTLASNGARHGLRDFSEVDNTTSLMLGTQISHETDGQPSLDADADIFEDGVVDQIFILAGEETLVDVFVTNNTGEDATLAGWIDLDGNGTFDPGELVTEIVPPGGGTFTLTFPAGTTADNTYARFRVFPGDVSDPQPLGAASSGEVEDYLVLSGRVHYEKTVDPDDVSVLNPGDDFTYTVTVSNLGSVDLTDLSFTDDLSEVVGDGDATYNGDVTVVSGPGVALFTPDQITWDLDGATLGVDEQAVITYSVTIADPPAGDAILFNGVIGTGPGSNCVDDPATDPDCFKEVPQPLIEGVKTSDTAGTVEAGETVTYEFTITNVGPGQANNAVVWDDLSGVLDEAAYNGDAVIDPLGQGQVNFDEANQRLEWNGPLDASGDPLDSVTITYSVTVNEADELDDGVMQNALLMTGCPNPPIFDPLDSGFDPDCVEIIDIEAWTSVKSSDAGSPVLPGDTVEYSLTVENTGNVDLLAAEVSIDDDLTSVLDDAFYNGDADQGATYVEPILSWTGDLAVDDVVTITYSVTVNDADELGDGQMDNAVTGAPNCPDPAVFDPDDSDYNPDCVQDPLVGAYTVVKTSDAVDPVLPGDVVEYTVVVTNTGAADLVDLDAADFSDDLSGVLDDATFNADEAADVGTATFADPEISWIGDLGVDDVATITYSVTVDQPIGGDHQLVNAVVGGDCPDPAVTDPEDAAFDESCVVVDPLPGVDIDKVIFGDPVTELQPGDTFDYVVTVTNVGQVALVGETFSDDLSEVLDDAELDQGSMTADIGVVNYADPELTWIGDLAIGETATIRYTIVIDDPITGDAELLNAVAGSIYSNCVPPDPQDPDCWEETPLPNVFVSKVLVGPAEPQPGDVVTYRVTAENQGGATALAEPITDDLSGVVDDAAYNNDAQASLSGALTYTAPTLEWVGDIAAGESLTVTYTVTVNAAGELGDGVLDNAVTGGENCPEDTEVCTTETPLPDVVVDKELVSPTDPEPGDVVTYRITAVNQGDATAIDEVVTDDLTGVLDDADYNDDATATGTGDLSYSAPILSWTGDIAAGETVTVTYSVTVNNAGELGDGVLDNAVTGGGTCPEDTEACQTRTPLAAVHYEKTIISPTDGQAQANGMLTYRVTVTNTGQTDLVDASFTDDLTNVLDNSAWIGDADATTGTVSYSQPILTWTGDLDAGEIAMVSYSVRVDDTIPAGTRLVNRVAGIGPGSNCPEGSTDPACLAAVVLTAAALPTLPFTGIEILGLLLGAFALVIMGALIRRAGREHWLDETQRS